MSTFILFFRTLMMVALVTWGTGLHAADGNGTGLAGSYFPNETLSGTPTVTRTDAQVNFNWAGGAAAVGMPVDSFSVRWEGEIQPRYSESYKLIARTDDGVRMWLDGVLVVDAWKLRGAVDSTYVFTAVAGQHYRIRMEYYEHFGAAVAKLQWQSAHEAKAAIPTSQLYPLPTDMTGVGSGTGLLASYFANETLSGTPVLNRTDARVDVDWAGGSPASGVPVDSFSARWDGEIQPRFTETYTLIARTDDGVRVWLDNALVIDAWKLRGATDSVCTFTAQAGQRYRIRMEYFEHTGSASARLWWQSASELRGPIPTSQLYPTAPNLTGIGSGTGLIAAYFPNENLSGTPALSRTDARVDFDWAGGSPGTGVPVDSFSARWDGEIQPRFSESYTLTARTDDGVRLWIDNNLVIDAWKLRGAADSTYTFTAEAGRHYRIHMEYFEHTGSASARLWWQSASELRGPIPTSQLYPVAPNLTGVGTGTGLAASYFANETLSGTPVLTRTDSRVDFDWAAGSPGTGVPVDSFSARWEGELQPRFSETYTLIARTDDGVKLWLDDVLVIDAWILRGATDSTSTFTAQAGRRYRIRMEYFERAGSASARLWWQSASELRGPIATTQLYPTTISVIPTIAFAAASASVSERVGNTTATISLSAAAAQDVTIALQSSTSDAQVPPTITILAGQTQAIVPVTILDDTRYGADRSATLSLSDPVGALLGTQITQVLTIRNVDPKPTLTFTAPTSMNLENSGTASIPLHLSALSSGVTQVTLSLSGSATSGSDYSAPGALFEIPADTLDATIFVTILPDTLPESDEQIIIALSAPVGADLGAITTHTITVSDGNQSPTIISGPTPAANPVTTNAVSLSVQATDDGGPQNLSYAWSVIGAAPASVTFTPTTSATTTANFLAPGTYTIAVAVTDAHLMTVTAQTTLTVVSIPQLITVTPTTTTVSVRGTTTFVGHAADQFGTALPIIWSVSSGGTIDTAGIFTAGDTAGPFTVTATSGTASATATVTVTNNAPPVLAAIETTPLLIPVGALATPVTSTITVTDVDSLNLTQATVQITGGYQNGSDVLSFTNANGISGVWNSAAGTMTLNGTATLAQCQTALRTVKFISTSSAPPSESLTAASFSVKTSTASALAAQSSTVGTRTVAFRAYDGAAWSTAVTREVSVDNTVAPLITTHPVNTTVTAGQTATFTVVASGTAPLTYQWKQGTATVGTNSATLSLTNAQSVNAGSYTCVVTNSAGTATSNAATLTVGTANVPTIAFQTATSIITEGGVALDIPVVLSQAYTLPVTVDYALSGTATGGGDDYYLPNGTLTFAPGEISKALIFQVRDDVSVESAETAIITLIAPTNSLLGTTKIHTVTISDNDDITVQVAAGDAISFEDGSHFGSFIFTRSGSVAAELTANVTLSGTATNGADYTDPSDSGSTIIFPVGVSSVTKSVIALPDTLYEIDETIIATVVAGTGYAVGAPSVATVTIRDDDVVTITASKPVAEEATTPVTGEFTLSRIGTAGDLTVTLAVSGSATTSDYTRSWTGNTVVIPADSSSVKLTITPVQDALVEGPETVIVSITPTTYTVGAAATATVTISDDDVPTVSIAVTDAITAEPGGDNATFTISRALSATTPLTVNYLVTGTATSGLDYTALTGIATIPANASSTTVTVTALGDQITEPDETVMLTLSSSPTYNIATAASATAVIKDCTISIVATDAIAMEPSGDNGIYTITRRFATTTDQTVQVAWGGSATVNTDFTTTPATTTTVTIPANATSITVTLVPTADSSVEGTESAVLSLVPTTTYAVGSSSSASVAIADATLTITANRNEITENPAQTATVTVKRTGYLSSALTVPFTLSGTATENADYSRNVIGGGVTIPAGLSSAIVTFSTINDTLVEGDETIIASIGPSSFGIVNASVTITIHDDDFPVVSLDVADAAASEAGSDPGAFTLSRTGPTTNALTVTLACGGTATAVADYTAIPTSITETGTITVTIPAGQESMPITITPVDDTISEPAETVILSILSQTTYRIGTAQAQIAIIDNDMPQVTVIATSPQAAEGGASGVFTLQRIGDPTIPISVGFTLSGTAMPGADFTALTSPITMDASVTTKDIYISPIDDAVPENDETVTLTLDTGTGYTLGTNKVATVTIADNDLPTVTLATIRSAAEGATPVTGIVRFTRTGNTTTALSIPFTLSGTASTVAGTDYTLSPNATPISIAIGATTADLIITPVNNAVAAGDKTVIVTLGSGSFNPGAPNSATVTIADDERPTISIVATDDTATEAGLTTATFTVTRSAASATALTVPYTVSGSATAGIDYVALSGSVTLPAGQTSATVVVTPRDDEEIETAESITLALNTGSGYVVDAAAPSATANIFSDDLPTPIVTYQFAQGLVAEGTGPTTDGLDLVAVLATTTTSGLTLAPTLISGGFVIRATLATAGITSAPVTLRYQDARGVLGPQTTTILRWPSGGGSTNQGDPNSAPLPPPTMTLTIAEGSLTGDKHGTIKGETVSFTNTSGNAATPIQVNVSASSQGAIDRITVSCSDGQTQDVLGASGTASFTIATDGIYTFSAFATATRGTQSAFQSVTGYESLLVDRTPPQLQVLAAPALWESPELPLVISEGVLRKDDIYGQEREYFIYLNSNAEDGYAGNRNLRKIRQQLAFNVDAFSVSVKAPSDLSGLKRAAVKIFDDNSTADDLSLLTSDINEIDGSFSGWSVSGFSAMINTYHFPHSFYSLNISDRCGNLAEDPYQNVSGYAPSDKIKLLFLADVHIPTLTNNLMRIDSPSSPVLSGPELYGPDKIEEGWQGSIAKENQMQPSGHSAFALRYLIDTSAFDADQIAKNETWFLRDAWGNILESNVAIYGVRPSTSVIYGTRVITNTDMFSGVITPSTIRIAGNTNRTRSPLGEWVYTYNPDIFHTTSTSGGFIEYKVASTLTYDASSYLISAIYDPNVPVGPVSGIAEEKKYVYNGALTEQGGYVSAGYGTAIVTVYPFTPGFGINRYYKPAILNYHPSFAKGQIEEEIQFDMPTVTSHIKEPFYCDFSTFWASIVAPDASHAIRKGNIISNRINMSWLDQLKNNNTNYVASVGSSHAYLNLIPYIYSQGETGRYPVYKATDIQCRPAFNLLHLSPEISASGHTVNFSIVGNFLDERFAIEDFDSTSSNYVHFINSNGDDMTVPISADNRMTTEGSKITILNQRLIVSPTYSIRDAQKLVVTAYIGSAVQPGLYSVDLNIGPVHAYPDALSQKYAGANGAHRMKDALAVIAIRGLDTENKDINGLAQASDPHPEIVLDPLTTADVTVTGYTARVHLRGTIRDILADVTPGHAADIANVLIGTDEISVPITPMADDKDLDLLRRPFAFKGRLDTQVTLNLSDGPNSIRVAAKNKIGNSSFATATINAVVDLIPERNDPYDRDPGVAIIAQMSPSGFNDSIIDTMYVLFPTPRVEGTVLGTETALASRTFAGMINGVGASWNISAPAASFSATKADAVILRLTGGRSVTEVVEMLVETGPATGTFLPAVYEPMALSEVVGTTCKLNALGQNLTLTRQTSGEYTGIDAAAQAVRVALEMPATGSSTVAKVAVIRVLAGIGGARVVAVAETALDSGIYITVVPSLFQLPGAYHEPRVQQVVRSFTCESTPGTSTGILMPIVVEVELPAALEMPDHIDVDGTAIPLRTHPDQPNSPKRYSKLPLIFVHKQGLNWTTDNVRTAEAGSGLVAVPKMAATQFAKTWSCDHPNDLPRIGRGLTAPITMRFTDMDQPPTGTQPSAWTVKPSVDHGWKVGTSDSPPTVTINPNGEWRKFWGLAQTANVVMEVVIDATAAQAPAPRPVDRMGRYLTYHQDDDILNFQEVDLYLGGKKWKESVYAFELVRPRIITWCVDGLGAHWFDQAMKEDGSYIQQVFGKPGKGNIVRTAQAALPTITWCNWAGIFTGKEPKDHGVYGNSFFRRDMPDKEPVFSGNDLEPGWIAGQKDGGSAEEGVKYSLDSLLRPGVATTYKSVTTLNIPEVSSRSILTWYGGLANKRISYVWNVITANAVEPLVPINFGAGSTNIIIAQTMPTGPGAFNKAAYKELGGFLGSEVGAAINGHEPNGRSAQFTDAFSVSRLIEAWSEGYPDDLTCVYLPGPDNYGHASAHDNSTGGVYDLENGNDKPYEHFKNHTARFMAVFHQRYVVEPGWAGATIYLLVSDHGQTVTAPEGHYDDAKGRLRAGVGETFHKNVHARYNVNDEDEPDEKVLQLSEVVDAVSGAAKNNLTTWLRRSQPDYTKDSVVVSSNGGLIYLYVQDQKLNDSDKGWARMPQTRVRELAGGIYEAAQGTLTNKVNGVAVPVYPEFKGALGDSVPTVIVRDTAEWKGAITNKLKVVMPNPNAAAPNALPFILTDLSVLTSRNALWVDVVRRINGLDDFATRGSGATRCPDIILIMNTAGGWNSVHEGEVLPGWHGGPSKADTMVPFALGFAGLKLNSGNQVVKDVINKAGTNRPTSDNGGPLQNRDMHQVMVDLLRRLNP